MQKNTLKQYAEAVYSLTKQESIVDQIISDLKTVLEKLNDSPAFYKHLQYPKLTMAEKEKNLQDIFSDFISKRTYRILMLFIKDRKIGSLDKIIAAIEKLKKTDENILDVEIYTPLTLKDEQGQKIKSILSEKTGKQVIIHESIESDLIGGIKINVNGMIIDGSIAGKIENLRKRISTSLY